MSDGVTILQKQATGQRCRAKRLVFLGASALPSQPYPHMYCSWLSMLPRQARLKDFGARTHVQTEIDLGAKFGVHRSRADPDCIVAAPVACDLYRNFIGRATRDCSSLMSHQCFSLAYCSRAFLMQLDCSQSWALGECKRTWTG
jgi:hypothetical protein